MEKVTLLVNSCDAYSDVWDLFFKALQVQWPDCKFPVVLLTESKSYSGYPGLKVINVNNPCWGARYKKALKEIQTPYIFPVLEDFVLQEKFTNENLFVQVIKWLDENPDIGVFYLHRHPNVLQNETEFEGFGLMPPKSDYKLTTMFGLWRKTYLDKCIKGYENPWEWELWVTRYAWRFKEREYALLESQPEYFIIPLGGVIRRGLWHPEAKPLSEKYGVEIDFSKRGFFDENNRYHVSKHFPRDIFKKRFWLESRQRITAEIRKAILKLIFKF